MPPEIISYKFGQIVIDDTKYNKDVIIFPDRVFANWWRKSGHRIEPDDLTEVVSAKPDVLIIGTGSFGMVTVPEETVQYIRDQGIEVFVERTKKALEHYHKLAKDRKTVAALHLTC
jgi:hypothetical protein